MNKQLLEIDRQILDINAAICKNIENIETLERGLVSVNVLAQLRTFVEHIMLKVHNHPNDAQDSYKDIRSAIKYTKTRGELRLLRRFHHYLQIATSHYTLDEENSERLMLKYYEFLLKTKQFLQQTYSLDVLQNLDKFPINIDLGLKEYHEKIAEKLNYHQTQRTSVEDNDRYYIHKIKPFFVNQSIYYEVTFTSTNVDASKFDRVIAFTYIDIAEFYAAKLFLFEDRIEIMGRTMSIFIITDWEVSIRPCEINNFSRIFGVPTNLTSGNAEYKNLMQYLTQTSLHLVEIIDFHNKAYDHLKQEISKNRTKLNFFSILDQCRSLSQNKSKGRNIVRYLLLRLNNKIIKRQLEKSYINSKLSEMWLKNGCIPFDDMPFNTSPIKHNPKISDLFECIQSEDRKHELFARFIRNNTEIRGHIYTPVEEVKKLGSAKTLVETYNKSLWFGHEGRRIKEFRQHLYISEYEDNTLIALRHLKDLAVSGIQNYSNAVNYWLDSNAHQVDCDEKKTTLRKMFASSKVALIYGAAGTGKSTLINHVSHLHAEYQKIYLANTNPAIENLKRKVNASSCSFSTIAKFLRKNSINHECDLLIIDECSTVSNRDIKEVLTKANFKLLLLVGDIYQIQSIRFGNWFSAVRSFIPETSIFELTIPYRTENRELLELWKKVRNQEDTIIEHITKNDYSRNLDVSIFNRTEDEEIILCLNYDGLYGINNINRFLQESNPNKGVPWGVYNYKVNDPILFNESNRFAPLIYNNMKGKIRGIELLKERKQIQFDIELDKVISGLDAEFWDFTLLDESTSAVNSVIRFTVNRYRATDEDDDNVGSNVVPFQVAYAVSIHKAQGLEYKSVKIVITDETDELITHNIFYTAITRARERLRIYWSPEVEKRVLDRFKSKKNNNKDVALLKLRDPNLVSS